MMGVSTLSLCSTNSMVVHSQAQHANLAFVNNGNVLALTGSKIQRLINRRLSFPMCLVPSISTISFKKSRPYGLFTTAVGAVASDQLSYSDPANKSEAKRYYFVVANAKFLLDEEEHFQEQLFERLRLFGERNEEQDFWLVIEPKFLDKFPNITKRLKRPALALVSTNGPWITFYGRKGSIPFIKIAMGHVRAVYTMLSKQAHKRVWFAFGMQNTRVPMQFLPKEVDPSFQGSPFGAINQTQFMKLRLDRVLTESFEAKNLEEALACNPTNLKFGKPEKWVAPYPKYEYGWWKPFLPHVQNEA